MQLYFNKIETIIRLTKELHLHQDQFQCLLCDKKDQFVSHGFVYKQLSMSSKEVVGKRILCSPRYGRSGCGQTLRLYVAQQIPSLHYNTTHIAVFLTLLLTHVSVNTAYQQATGQLDSRNAWRWLSKLTGQLTAFRCFLQTRCEKTHCDQQSRSRQLRILLPTIEQLFSRFNDHLCSSYQQQAQSAFI